MKILPPLIMHDGSHEGRRMAMLMRCLVPWCEVIDASAAAGRERLRRINEGLKEGTLDTRTPPLALGNPAVIFKGLRPEYP